MAITQGLDGSGQGLWSVLLNNFSSTSIKQITKNKWTYKVGLFVAVFFGF
jgi:hypothetical protein